jgi:hypothetical protein
MERRSIGREDTSGRTSEVGAADREQVVEYVEDVR